MAEPPPFSTSLRRDPDDPRGLGARIDDQIIERIEEALKFYLLDLLLKRRASQGRPTASEDNPRDRKEFQRLLEEFLTFAETELHSALPPLPAQDPPRPGQKGDRKSRSLAFQASCARRLPDYWQRLDTIMVAFTASCLEERPRIGFFKRLLPVRYR